MTRTPHRLALLLGAAIVAFGTAAASAATHRVPAGALARVLTDAASGDTLVLLPGVHPGPVVLDKPVTLTAEPGAVVDGGGQASTILIDAPDVTVRGVEVRNSGVSLIDKHSGIFVNKGADRAVVENNRVLGNLIGIYVWGGRDALVQGNDIVGRTDLHRSTRGNGIQIWNAPGTKVLDNHVRDGRDGILVTSSKRNVFSRNRFERVRIAVHYMNTDDSELSDNISIGNTVGFAVMYSNNLVVRGNLSRGDRDHGLMLNSANRSIIAGNIVEGRHAAAMMEEQVGVDDAEMDKDMPSGTETPDARRRAGTWKCVFVYNAAKNQLTGNRFDGCEIGIHFTAGSERNVIAGNAFLGNRTQVKYVGTRSLEWSAGGRGNYWSDNAAFDLNGDGVADEPYRPNDVVDRVVWSYPMAKLLMNSPGVQVIRWAQKRFPALHPGGVTDSAPLVRPPAITLPLADSTALASAGTPRILP